MPKLDNQRSNQPRTNTYQSNNDDKDDTVSAENEKWNPTPEAFKAFMLRDSQLAAHNITSLLLSAGRPLSVREIKESSLHSIDMIEGVLASDIFAESKGKYIIADTRLN